MSRPPASDETLKLHGGWRADRHGGRPKATGELGSAPRWLDDMARQWWRDHAAQLAANGVGAGDRSIVESAATWYSLWRKTLAAIEAGDGEYRTFCRLSMAWKSFVVAASRLGIGPTERSKIRKGGPTTAGKLEKYTGGVASRRRGAT